MCDVSVLYVAIYTLCNLVCTRYGFMGASCSAVLAMWHIEIDIKPAVAIRKTTTVKAAADESQLV